MYIKKLAIQLSSSRWLSGIDVRLTVINSAESWVRAPLLLFFLIVILSPYTNKHFENIVHHVKL